MGCEHDLKLESIQDQPELNRLLGAMGVSIGKFLLREDIPLLWANDVFYSSIGYTSETYHSQFSNMRHYYQDYAEDFQIIRKSLFHALENRETNIKLTSRMPIKGGRFIWIQMTGTITDETVDGFPVFYVNITDISEMVDLKEQKEQYFEFMMQEYVGNIYISDMDTYELLYLNDTSCETLQQPKEKLLGKKCYEIIQGRTSPCPFCTNDRLNEDEFYEWEFFNPILDRTFMIKNRQINWFGHRARIELSHDMYSAEYKLAKKDREREALIRTIPGGLCRLDARDLSTILWCGNGFLETIGYTKKQFEEELHSQLSYIHSDDMGRVISILRDMKETHKNAAIEARVITHGGETRILTMTLSYVSGEDSWDSIPSFYSVCIDITQERTEQERQRKALEDAYQSVRIANTAKTDFLSSMSHDIRTPMNAIVGMTAIAQANLSSSDKVRDCLNKINVSSRHLLSLINEVLDMSKIESGKVDLAPEDIDLSELVQGVSDMCRPLFTEKNQDFKINIGQVRHEKIVADGDRLRQVFMNLLSNAVKYTPEGGNISLTINEMPSLIPQKGWYEFVFKDDGIGMSDAYIPHIFEPFTRAEDSRINKIQGTGLGMAITENIVHMMNGTIKVESELGLGSQFTVSIPLQLQRAEESLNEELIGLPVLVVDDDQIVCENATMMLDELGMRGYWVLSGQEAVRRVTDAHDRADDFFAVILDWKMPGMDGLETLRAIRSQLDDDIPIIIISAYDYAEIEDEFVRAGADAFITKPLFKSKMLHVLQLFCASRKMEAAESPEQKESSGLQGKRILLTEDNELNREIATELLEMQGILVESAENGAEAIERFDESSPGYYSAILMDIEMPVMNGYDAATAIRAMSREDAVTIPILALTANAFVSDIGKAQSVGMNDHISKPIDMECLTKALLRWIGENE